MLTNNSPWLKELKRTNQIGKLEQDLKTEVAIIGGGIAGITTAYYLLKNTKKKVTLVEGYKIAHGATGHNAGQLVGEFERPFYDIVNEFGLELASQAQNDVNSTWDLVKKLFKETKLGVNLDLFVGHNGYRTSEQIFAALEELYLKNKGGVKIYKAKVSKTYIEKNPIPDLYKEIYEVVEPKNVLDLLETEDNSYQMCIPKDAGCLNSALFCEELVGYMLMKYHTRFKVYEHTPVHSVVLQEKWGIILTAENMITAENIILCTNGFENLNIHNTLDPTTNRRFHDLVIGLIGYMSAYVEESDNAPTALSYLLDTKSLGTDDYVYMTRRNYRIGDKEGLKKLICLGGPVIRLEDKKMYEKEHNYPESIFEMMDGFLKKTYREFTQNNTEFRFSWHGLMGYTSNGIRCVGKEPTNPILMYNLGCNGVGILTSIYGANKLSHMIKGEPLPESIFDPHFS